MNEAAVLERIARLEEVVKLQTATINDLIEKLFPPDGDASVAAVLRAISGEIGNETFSVASLKDSLDYAPDLRAAILAVHGEVNGKRLGWLLRNALGRDYGGIWVERVSEGKASVWRVCRY